MEMMTNKGELVTLFLQPFPDSCRNHFRPLEMYSRHSQSSPPHLTLQASEVNGLLPAAAVSCECVARTALYPYFCAKLPLCLLLPIKMLLLYGLLQIFNIFYMIQQPI